VIISSCTAGDPFRPSWLLAYKAAITRGKRRQILEATFHQLNMTYTLPNQTDGPRKIKTINYKSPNNT